MKRVFVVLSVLAISGVVWAVEWARDTSEKIITVTTSATADATVASDTIQIAPKISPLYPYRGFIVKVKVHAKPILSSTNHGVGLADTVIIAIKRRDGIRAPQLIDSTKFAIRALNTTACSTLVQMHPIDSLWMENMFAVVRVADTTSDSAGITIAVRATSEILVKN